MMPVATEHPDRWRLAKHLGVSAQAVHRRYRWLHYDPSSGHAWQEPPLKLT